MTDRDQEHVQQIWESWRAGHDEHLDELLAAADQLCPDQLIEVLLVDQARRFELGDPLPVEHYLAQCPALAEGEPAVDLVYHDILLRERAGQEVAPEEYLERFPKLAELLRRQLLIRGVLPSRIGDEAGNTAAIVPGATSSANGGPQGVAPSHVGRFEIREQIGSGGFGTVYLAYDPKLKREVALKLLHARRWSDEHRQRFEREAQAAARLSHPNIVEVYEFRAEGNLFYIVCQYIAGETLSRRIRRGQVAPVEAAGWVRKLATALHHAHTMGVIHRDLKSANILLDKEGKPYISDFGLARVEDERSLTQDAGVLGTLQYMSPEQARGESHDADARSDVYSLGVVLYELLAGRIPFDGPPAGVLRKVLEEEAPPLRQFNPRVSRDLVTICATAMAKDAERRYPSSQHLADDLGRWLDHRPIHARPVGPVTRVAKWTRRRPAQAALLLLFVTALVGLIGGIIWRNIVRERTRITLTNLARARAQSGVDRLKQGDPHGLFDLLEAHQTATGIEDTQTTKSLERAWRHWQAASAGRLLQMCSLDGERILAAAMHPYEDVVAVKVQCREASRTWLWHLRSGRFHGKAWRTNDASHAMALGPHGHLLRAQQQGAQFVLAQYDGRTGVASELAEIGSSAIRNNPGGNLLAVCTKEAVQVWNLRHDPPSFSRLGHEPADSFQLVAISADEKWLAVAMWSGTIRLWKLSEMPPRPVRLSHVGENQVEKIKTLQLDDLVFSQNAKLLASAGYDNTVKIWDVVTGRRLFQLVHEEDVKDVAFSLDDTRIVTGSFDSTARVWDAATGRPLGPPLRHDGPVRTVDFHPNGRLIATGSDDGAARIWHAESGEPLGMQMRHQGVVQWVKFTRDGRRLVTVGRDMTVRVWDFRAGIPAARQLRAVSSGPRRADNADRFWSVACSSSGRLIAGGSRDGRVTIWETATNRKAGQFQLIKGRDFCVVYGLAFHPNEKYLAATTAEGVFVLDVQQRHQINVGPLPHRGEGVFNSQDVAFSPTEDKYLAACSNDGWVQLWDTTTWKPLAKRYRHGQGQVIAISFSPDGSLLASGSAARGTVKIWRLSDDALLHTISHPPSVDDLAFSADGTLLATAGRDYTIRFWDVVTGQSAGTPLRQPSIIQRIAFGPQEDLLATALSDGRVHLWDAHTGLQCGPGRDNGPFASDVVFGPEGRFLASSSFDASVRVWQLPTRLSSPLADEAMSRATCLATGTSPGAQRVPRALSRVDWNRLRREKLKTE